MELSKKLKTEEIEYFVVKSKRKTVAIEVNKNGEVILRLPLLFPKNEIPKIVLGKKQWILKAVERQKSRPFRKEYIGKEREEVRKKAREVIGAMVERYSTVMGLIPSAVKINFAKTRFGSCSAKNSLNFSVYILDYPKAVQEYVVVHELAHIKYKNHGEKFYMLIEKYLPDYRNRIKMLKS